MRLFKSCRGSTPAQKLLVSTILEHLNRAAKDASDDSQMELDLNKHLASGSLQRHLGIAEGYVYPRLFYVCISDEGSLRREDFSGRIVDLKLNVLHFRLA